jgi:hypothetical protein
MATYRLKSKLFYTPGEKKSYNAGIKAGQKRMQAQMNQKMKNLQSQLDAAQNKPGMGTGVALGAVGTIGSVAGLGAYKQKKEEEYQQQISNY